MTALAAHPVADLFPMLSDEELAELAADITQRGLLHPIVLDSEGRILDGRNRHAACEIAGIKPAFWTYAGDDAAGYALSVNLARRNLTTGAKAIIAARAARLDGDTTRKSAADTSLYQPRVAEANVILAFAPDLADAVIAGSTALSVAVKTARDRKRAAEDADNQMAQLRAAAPDLADLVAEERMTLPDALAAQRARAAQRESERRAATVNLRSVLLYLTSAVLKPDELADDYADVLTEFAWADLDYAVQTMTAIAQRKKEQA